MPKSGVYARRSGQRPQAQERLSTASPMLREMGMRYWLNQAQTELAAVG
jgi:hypothetical protein